MSNKMSKMKNLKELFLQNNELTLLPPTLADIKELEVLKLEDNPWIEPIEFNRIVGLHHVTEFLASNVYSRIYARQSVRL